MSCFLINAMLVVVGFIPFTILTIIAVVFRAATPIVYAIIVASLAIGSIGFLSKRVILFNYRWIWALVVICLSPQFCGSSFSVTDTQQFDWGTVLSPIVLAGMLYYLWRLMSGYVAFGITDKMLMEALYAALKSHPFAYDQENSKIHLENENIDLLVSTQNWIGFARIRASNGQHKILAQIVTEINKYLYNNKIVPDLISHGICFLLGIVMLVVLSSFYINYSFNFF